MAPDTIIGRTAELDAVTRFVDRESSEVRGLVIEGEAGIGKTTVWREAARTAATRGLVLTSRAAEVEARLSFTSLDDLVLPALDEDLLGRLSVGQRRGLESALLLAERAASRTDQRAVSLAVLEVLRSLAQREPLTIAIDDIQWVDVPSARALAFALRRLEDVPVVVIAARRLQAGAADPLDLAHTLAGRLERVQLAPLDAAVLGRILRSSLGRGFPPPLVARIHEQSGGNPFYALEIARALSPDTVLPAGQPLPLPADLDELLRRRLSALSPGARDACLVIATMPQPTEHVVEEVGVPVAAIRELCDTEIVAIHESRLEFMHPLLASTVYGSASAQERRNVHERLAEIARDPEERARHLALSARGPSEEVAAALDQAAHDARDRGAPLAAAELLELGAMLTPAGSERLGARQRMAAVERFDAGDGDGARRVLGQLLDRLEPGPERATTLFTLSFMSWNDLPLVSRLLAEALDQCGDDAPLRARILADTAWSLYQACRPDDAADVARAALELAEPLADPFPRRHSLSVLAAAETLRGHPAWELIERAVALEVAAVPGESTGPSIVMGQLLLWAGDVDGARTVLESALDRFVGQGRLAGTWEIAATLAEVELRAGRWSTAAGHAEDALETAVDVGRSNETTRILAIKAQIAASQGDVERALSDGVEALAASERNGDAWNELAARSALGFLELSQGDATAARAWLDPAVRACEQAEIREPGAFPIVPDQVEALVALGEIDEAERLTEQLDARGRQRERPLALATAARCRGLIAGSRGELELAADALDRALVEHRRVEHPLETARTLLVAGEVQRRMKQKRRAREFLGQARDSFDSLGAPLWATRARAELARVGGRPPSPDGLTPTEAEVAQLVAQGLTNREVAHALFISPHTVDANLRRIYRKLQVRSRTELARRL